MSDIELNRELMLSDFKSAEIKNRRDFQRGKDNATSEYIYENQKIDASNIVDIFYTNRECRAISVQKKTKIGADGLMLQIAKLMTTHSDDNFAIDPENIRIITGMSNKKWESDMIDKAPNCLKDKIFHHGQLKNSNLKKIKNALIIVDEIDSGDGEGQVLHNILKKYKLLNAKRWVKRNVRFIFISATMIRELYDTYQWGKLHEMYTMTIPDSYIGHSEFLSLGIVKEFYSLLDEEGINKWIDEDIISYYGNDYRVHFVRVDPKKKNITKIEKVCREKGISFRKHISESPLTKEEEDEFFNEEIQNHIVVAIKGYYRRASLIPNKWKLHIGATHELYTKKVDFSVQIQGLMGRLTGYWKDDIINGHKTGPHRTSIEAIEQYEKVYNDPFGKGVYNTRGFSKEITDTMSKISMDDTMLSHKNIKHIVPVELPVVVSNTFERGYSVFRTQDENEAFAKTVGAKRKTSYKLDKDGFMICSTSTRGVHSLQEVLDIATNANIGSNMDKKLEQLSVGEYCHRRYACYETPGDLSSKRFVTIWVRRIQ